MRKPADTAAPPRRNGRQSTDRRRTSVDRAKDRRARFSAGRNRSRAAASSALRAPSLPALWLLGAVPDLPAALPSPPHYLGADSLVLLDLIQSCPALRHPRLPKLERRGCRHRRAAATPSRTAMPGHDGYRCALRSSSGKSSGGDRFPSTFPTTPPRSAASPRSRAMPRQRRPTASSAAAPARLA